MASLRSLIITFLPVLLFILLPLSLLGDPHLSSDSIAFPWKISRLMPAGSDQPLALSFSDRFELNPDGSFFLSLSKEGREERGKWNIRNDSLVLWFERIPVTAVIDSIVYKAEKGEAVLSLFSEGEAIATEGDAGLESRRRELVYGITLHKNKNISLRSASETLDLTGRAAMLREGFSFMDVLRGLLGLFVLLLIAYGVSTNRKKIDWKLVGTGIGLQLVLAVLVLKVPGVKLIFSWIARAFVEILGFSNAGARFLFGPLMDDATFGMIFAFQILPTIVFFSALTAALYYLGILQRVVFAFAWLMSKTMRLSGAESLAAAGNIFLGQTESPLLVRPYLERMTRSEVMCLMTGGMATIAGGVFAAYIKYLGGTDPAQLELFATHLLTASIMSAPAAIVAAKIMIPETEPVNQEVTVPEDKLGSNLLDAISKGTVDGLKLAVNVGVMLLVFIALIEMLNFFFGSMIGEWTGLNEVVASATGGRYNTLSLQYLFGLAFSPLAWLLGVPIEDSVIIGQLLGEKTIINEFVAYASLGTAKTAGLIVNYKSLIIATYALCGFANFASIGIQIGGIGALAPNQWETLSRLGIRALIGGTIAAFMTASIAGMLSGW